MEFSYDNYYVRYILNQTDFILRFEDKNTGKLYEETYFERDFLMYSAIGGIEFVSRLLVEALEKKNDAITIASCVLEDAEVHICFRYVFPLSPKPIEISLVLKQKRRDSASEDTLDLGRKLRMMEEKYQALLEKEIEKEKREEKEKTERHFQNIQYLQKQVDLFKAELAGSMEEKYQLLLQKHTGFTKDENITDYAAVTCNNLYDKVTLLSGRGFGYEYMEEQAKVEWNTFKLELLQIIILTAVIGSLKSVWLRGSSLAETYHV